MENTQSGTPGAEQNKKGYFKSSWLYIIVGTLAFVVGGFVVWQVYNYNLDEEINQSAEIKTRLTERKAPSPAPAMKPNQEKPAGQK